MHPSWHEYVLSLLSYTSTYVGACKSGFISNHVHFKYFTVQALKFCIPNLRGFFIGLAAAEAGQSVVIASCCPCLTTGVAQEFTPVQTVCVKRHKIISTSLQAFAYLFCVCMSECACVCMHVCTVYVYVCMNVWECVCIGVCVHLCTGCSYELSCAIEPRCMSLQTCCCLCRCWSYCQRRSSGLKSGYRITSSELCVACYELGGMCLL